MGEITFALVRSLPGVVKIRLAQVVIFRLSFASLVGIIIKNGTKPSIGAFYSRLALDNKFTLDLEMELPLRLLQNPGKNT